MSRSTFAELIFAFITTTGALMLTLCLIQQHAVTTIHARNLLSPPLAARRAPTTTYKPVILVHGIFSNASALDALKDAIAEAHPGTEIYDTNFYANQVSVTDLWTQTLNIGAFVKNISDANPDGFHLLGFSQGGLIARGILQVTNDLNVRNFIALSSPLNGQYGVEELKWFTNWEKKDVYILLYNPVGQMMSVGNYWRDPHHLRGFYKENVYLPVLNNESVSVHPDSMQYKKNFLRIQKLIMVGGKDDGVITPYQSAFFAAYKSDESVQDVEDMEFYKRDYFGLRTLDERGKVVRHNVSGIGHHMWSRTKSVIDECILPYLD